MIPISPSFTAQNTWAGGIRRNQVEAALGSPDGRVDLTVGDAATITLVTKRVDRPRPHVIVLVASEAGGKPWAVTSGYRLYGVDAELAPLAADPRAALDEVIRRFGREFTVNGGAPTRFIEHLRVDDADLDIKTGDGDLTMSSFVRRDAAGGFDISYVWAIDEARYRAALSSN